MKQRLHRRLAELREEYARGEGAMKELDSKREELASTLLRIGGAIQVLEEELYHAEQVEAGAHISLAEAEGE